MTGKIKITFEPTTIEYSSVSFELEVENEKEFMDIVSSIKLLELIAKMINILYQWFKKSE